MQLITFWFPVLTNKNNTIYIDQIYIDSYFEFSCYFISVLFSFSFVGYYKNKTHFKIIELKKK